MARAPGCDCCFCKEQRRLKEQEKKRASIIHRRLTGEDLEDESSREKERP